MFEGLKIAIDKGTRKHKAHVAKERGAQRLKGRGIKRKPGKKAGAGMKKKNGNNGFAKKKKKTTNQKKGKKGKKGKK
jgi:hypothetical protein